MEKTGGVKAKAAAKAEWTKHKLLKPERLRGKEKKPKPPKQSRAGICKAFHSCGRFIAGGG